SFATPSPACSKTSAPSPTPVCSTVIAGRNGNGTHATSSCEGVHDTLTELRRRGLHLGIVSNIDQDQLEHLIDLAQLRRYFDSLLSSEHARSCKPDSAIYEEALRRAGCAAEEALFVGDTLLQDIAGANRMGMHSVLLWHRADRQPPSDGVQPAHVI